MKEYPDKLYHKVPSWVESGAVFHVRIRSELPDGLALTDKGVGDAILESVIHYTEKHYWYHHLFMIMPDHVHALLSFPIEKSMSQAIRNWKRYHKRFNNLVW